MKKISLTLFFLFANSLLAIVFLFYSCNTKEYRAVFTGITSTLIDYSKPSGADLRIDTCNFGSTSVFLKLNYEVLNAFITPRLGNSAYALQWDEPQIRIAEGIVDIRVIPLYDYNATIFKGDDISPEVSWQIDGKDYGQSGNSDKLTKDEFLNNINRQMGSINSNNYRTCSFSFNEAPMFASKQQFAIELDLYGGTRLQDTTIAFFFSSLKFI